VSENKKMAHNPRVFISYSWDSPEHKDWVKSFANELRKSGIDARLDAYRNESQSIDDFMMIELERADFVLAICTPQFKQKIIENAEGIATASGFEIGTAAALRRMGGKDVIPVLRAGEWTEAAPSNLLSYRFYDFTKSDVSGEFDQLKNRLLGHRELPEELGAVATPPPDPDLPDIFDTDVARAGPPATQQPQTTAAPVKAGFSKKLLIGAVGAIIVALVGAVFLLSKTPSTSDEKERSLAVLPFANISGDADDEPFVAGLHEDLLTQLSRLNTIRTISRTSVLQYQDTNLSIPAIAEQLRVASVIQGSVQKDGERLRIQAQLIDGKTDEYLWSESFDRQLTANDIFDIQREIAIAISSSLDIELSGAEKTRLSDPATENLEAYSAYMLGKQRVELRTARALDEAIEHLRRAVSLDPGFAAAHAQLAMAYDLASWYGDLATDEMLALAMPSAQRAIELDPALADGWTALASLRLASDDSPGAEEAYKKAIELNPNYPLALHWYALFLTQRGDYEAALTLHQKALVLDPLSVTLMNNVGQDFFYLDRKQEALAMYERSLERDPNFAPTHAHLANIYAYGFGQPDEAARWLQSAAQLDDRHTEYPSQLAMLLLDLDDPETALVWAQRALELGPNRYWPVSAMLRVSYRLGDEEATNRYAENLLSIYSQSSLALRILRDRDLKQDQPEVARARYGDANPELFQSPPRITEVNFNKAIDLALVLRALGDVEAADILLEGASKFVFGRQRSGPSGIQFLDIEVLAMRGETDAALDALEQAAESDWVEFWWDAPLNPTLSSLHQLPRFLAAMEKLKSRAAEYRANVKLTESEVN